MKIALIAAMFATLSTQVFAADFSDLSNPKFSSIQVAAPQSPALVSLDAANKAEDNTVGYIKFINWGLYDNYTKSGAIVIYGAVAKTMYDTMTKAKYRPAPANFASYTPAQVSRDICEARVAKSITCLKIPKFSADGKTLVLTNGKPTYTADSYQCDIHISDAQTMEFSAN